MIRTIALLMTLGLSSLANAQASSSSIDTGSAKTEVETSVKDKFSCAGGKRATRTADVQKLFKEILGIDKVQVGKYFLENEGYKGNRVILKVRPGETFQLQLVRSRGGILPATMCWQKGKGRRMELIASLDASQLGYAKYSVTITNPNKTKDEVNMVGSGDLSTLINFDYTLTDAVK